MITIDGVCQLTSPADQEVPMGFFELLHGAIIVSESAAAVERSRSIELNNIDDVVAYAQASSSLLVRQRRSLGSGSRLVAPVEDPARVHEWERRPLSVPGNVGRENVSDESHSCAESYRT